MQDLLFDEFGTTEGFKQFEGRKLQRGEFSIVADKLDEPGTGLRILDQLRSGIFEFLCERRKTLDYASLECFNFHQSIFRLDILHFFIFVFLEYQ